MMTTIPNRWMFIDPEPEIRGILLSDRIEAYVRKYQLFVDTHHFQPANLKPASYSLTLSGKYYTNGETFEIEPQGSLVVPPNSFVIAGLKEKLVLPHWCAVRFGLRVAYVYEGLLMGAGPQVDPGFEGYLGCPLHNLTNCNIKIKLGEPFAWIDFTKTSRLGQNPRLASDDILLETAAIQNRDRLQKRVWVIPGLHDFECRLYETQRLSFENSLPSGKTVSSSVKGLENDISKIESAWNTRDKDMEKKINGLTNVSQKINVGSIAGLVFLFITVLLTIGIEIWMPRKATLIKMQEQIDMLNQRIQETRPAVSPPTVVVPPAASATPTRTSTGR
jgi:deoxycytidine triphosphate deaminase